MVSKFFSVFFFFFIWKTFAIVPVPIATVDRSLWPYKMDSNTSFDISSKCEMLVFIEVLNKFDNLSENVLINELGVKTFNTTSIEKWRNKVKVEIVNNFKSLSDGSLNEVVSVKKNSSWETLSAIPLGSKMPKNLEKWYLASQRFYKMYIIEQLRLAAMFPRITSEVFQITDDEVLGDDFSQKSFLLTFDDGPTPKNGNTDKLISVLQKESLSGLFFLLGDNLNNRTKTQSLKDIRVMYGTNKVASHGKVHKSHQGYAEWKESIDYTNNLIIQIFNPQNNKMVYFRPPYGQRKQNSIDYIKKNHSKIILWNMDSQDWSGNITAKQVADRQITLMLLWRKGILLFHDVHSKAQFAVPYIHDYFKNASVNWMSPNQI